MKKLWVIAKKDILEAFRSRTMYTFIIIMVVLTFSYIAGYNRNVTGFTTQKGIIDYSRSFLTGLSYILPMMYSIFVCSVFANYSVIVDKAKRTLESLLATPVSVNEVWMGKSLAVAVPSSVIGVVISVISYLILNIGFIMPKAGSFIFPSPLAVLNALVVVPVLVFAIVTIVVNIQLRITNPRIGNFVFSGIFILLVLGVNALGGLGVSLNFFPLLYLGVIVLSGAISLVLSRSLTTEKVLLSSKM